VRRLQGRADSVQECWGKVGAARVVGRLAWLLWVGVGQARIVRARAPEKARRHTHTHTHSFQLLLLVQA